MPGPFYWNKTDGWFPVQSGSPVLIDQDAFEECCCVTFSQTWSFTDSGFIDGGQDGAYRAYDDPADVPASPWSILNGGLGLRLDWEDDENCQSHNPYTQYATATAVIVVPRAVRIRMGAMLPASRSSWQRERPSPSGRPRSRMIRSGAFS